MNKKIVVISVIICLSCLLSASNAFAADNVEAKKIVNYAKKHALKENANPNYHIFDNVDCTNFASQCLKAGGLKEDNSYGLCGIQRDNNKWFYDGNAFVYTTTTAWTTVEGLHDYIVYQTAMKNKSYETYHTCIKEDFLKNIKAGDIFQIGYKSTDGKLHRNHSMVCVSVDKNRTSKGIKFASHTSYYESDSFDSINYRTEKNYKSKYGKKMYRMLYTYIRCGK